MDTEQNQEPNPFLTGTDVQVAWDSTSLSYLKDCPRKYQLSMLQHWRLSAENVHLTFGRLYHEALERFDRAKFAGATHEDCVRVVTAFLMEHPFESDHTAKNHQTLIRTVLWYLEHFKDDPAQTYRLANGSPAVELSFRMELDFGPIEGVNYVLCGHLDRVVEYNDDLYTSDRKTTGSALNAGYFGNFNLDNQMSLYSIAGGVVIGSPVSGVMIDAAQVIVSESRFARAFTYRTAEQSEEWLSDLEHWLRLAVAYAEANHWPMNDRACRMCAFQRVCSKPPAIRENILKTHYTQVTWNPLAPRKETVNARL